MKIKNNEAKMLRVLEKDIFPYMPSNITRLLNLLPKNKLIWLEELRIRLARPMMLVIKDEDFMINLQGKFTQNVRDEVYIVTKEDISKILQFISQSSIYAIEEELKNGFITLRGGHRVGITGKAVIENGSIRTLTNISGLNIRIAREVKNVADKVLPFIINSRGGVYNTLIISPPKAGKTTLLRDIIRQLSDGIKKFGLKGLNIGLVDERSEVACCYNGIPQNDVGIRTDVLDGCPKAQGIIMLLRTMSPDVIATDEIGRQEDVVALTEAINAGVSIIATAHGASLEEVKKRPILEKLIKNRFFKRYLVLGFSKGVGTLERVIRGDDFMPVSNIFNIGGSIDVSENIR